MASLAASDQKQAHIDARMLQSSKLAALGKMAAGVAHEVNNPLMLIQENAGWIRDLLEDEKPESMKNYQEVLESTEKIEQHVKRAKGITQRMLGFGRRMNPSRTEILLNSLADQAVEMLKTEAASRNIVIKKEFDPQLPVILSDPAQLEQVFINIIDNAIDAMADLPNGKKHLTITLTENLKEYVFSVANTGTPIAPDDQQRIFEPGVTTKSDGHGMGLFIVRETLRHYGGDIQVTSDAQETVFSGTVPKDTTIPEAKAAQENSTNA